MAKAGKGGEAACPYGCHGFADRDSKCDACLAVADKAKDGKGESAQRIAALRGEALAYQDDAQVELCDAALAGDAAARARCLEVLAEAQVQAQERVS